MGIDGRTKCFSMDSSSFNNMDVNMSDEEKTTWDLVKEGKACPHCGATWEHRHLYPLCMPFEYWTWRPKIDEKEVK